MSRRLPPSPRKFSPAMQRRMDALLDKNAEGTITPTEKARLEALVSEAEQLMVANSKRLAEFVQSEQGNPPPGSVPVTIWVKAETPSRSA